MLIITPGLTTFTYLMSYSTALIGWLSLICRTCSAHRLHFPQRRSNYGDINSCFLYLLKVATRVRISGQGNDRRLLIRIIIWPKIKHQIAPSRGRQRERERAATQPSSIYIETWVGRLGIHPVHMWKLSQLIMKTFAQLSEAFNKRPNGKDTKGIQTKLLS